MPLQAIYFDIGGVLVRTENRQPRQQLAARLGTTYETLSELVFGGESGRRAQLGQITTERQWAYVCAQVGWPVADWRTLESEFFAGDELDTSLLDFLRGLRPHYKTGIISNALDDVRRVAVERWELDRVFDVLIFSAEVGVMKPDARIFRRALQALNVPPDRAVFVDDFAHNIEGARAVGMQAIHFRNAAQAREELERLLAAAEQQS